MVGEGAYSVDLSTRRTLHEGPGNHRTPFRKVSPKGPGSGMRMLTFFINRAGKTLSKSPRSKLERAKALLSERVKTARSAKKEA